MMVTVLEVVLASQVLADSSSEDSGSIGLLFLLAGPLFWVAIYLRYRNTNKRHNHETETAASVHNLVADDRFVKSRKGLSNRSMRDRNHTVVNGARIRGLF